MQSEKETLKYLKIFLVVVAVAALVSLAYRTFTYIRDSSFRYDTFNLLIMDTKTSIIRIDRAQRKMSIVSLPKSEKLLKMKTRLARSIETGAALDAVIVYKGGELGINKEFLDSSLMLKLLLNSGSFDLENINPADVVKLFLETGKIADTDKTAQNASSLEEATRLIEASGIYDQKIFNEKKSVQIINSTGVDGLGGKLSSVLKGLGYNVIAVDSGEDPDSSIKSGEDGTHSIKRIMELHGFNLTLDERNGISDITIILGRDVAKQLASDEEIEK